MITKSLNILRHGKLLTPKFQPLNNAIRKSHGAWSYRTADPGNPKSILYAAEGICAFAWWWVLWHLWTEPGHITGEFEFPDASKWTNEELGIPED